MEIKGIPERVYKVWESPPDVNTVANLMDDLKLQCSKCDNVFVGEEKFGTHIRFCLNNSDRVEDTEYMMHKHANRLVCFQNRVALFCGVSQQQGPILDCPLCKEKCRDQVSIRRHIRKCARYSEQYRSYIRRTAELFNSLLLSHEQLGEIFRDYDKDRHLLAIKRLRRRRPALVRPYLKGSRRHLLLDHIEEHFIKEYQDYLFMVCDLMDDLFLCSLKTENEDRMHHLGSHFVHNVYHVPPRSTLNPKNDHKNLGVGKRNKKRRQCMCGCDYHH